MNVLRTMVFRRGQLPDPDTLDTRPRRWLNQARRQLDDHPAIEAVIFSDLPPTRNGFRRPRCILPRRTHVRAQVIYRDVVQRAWYAVVPASGPVDVQEVPLTETA